MRRSVSKASLKSTESPPDVTVPPSSASAPANLNIPSPTSAASLSSAFSPVPNLFDVAANVAMMERTPFAIDDAKDEDEESDEDEETEDDDVLDEVDAFLEAHDTGLTTEEQELAKGTFVCPAITS